MKDISLKFIKQNFFSIKTKSVEFSYIYVIFNAIKKSKLLIVLSFLLFCVSYVFNHNSG